jgi:hypothetical protein
MISFFMSKVPKTKKIKTEPKEKSAEASQRPKKISKVNIQIFSLITCDHHNIKCYFRVCLRVNNFNFNSIGPRPDVKQKEIE